MVNLLNWLQSHNTPFIITTLIVSLLPTLLNTSLMYRRNQTGRLCDRPPQSLVTPLLPLKTPNPSTISSM